MQTSAARVLRDEETESSRHTADVVPLRPGGRFAREPVATGERRTIVISGHPDPPRRRRSATEQRLVARPDRVALWAFLLGLFLVLVAAVTANAAPL
jgi:hypothetical protein